MVIWVTLRGFVIGLPCGVFVVVWENPPVVLTGGLLTTVFSNTRIYRQLWSGKYQHLAVRSGFNFAVVANP